jgi:transcription antitermination factor NusG
MALADSTSAHTRHRASGFASGSGRSVAVMSPPMIGTPATAVGASYPWHAIWTRSKHEPLVCTELSAKGIDAFLPTVTRVSQWSDRTKQIASPLFPGYCFARFEPDLLSKVVRCNGVVTVLSNAGRPIPIPGLEIEALQRMVASGVRYDPCPGLMPGAQVRVVSGPLTGVTGRLVRKGAEDLLILAVELLNSGARIQVSAWDIERLD